jgi:hypothetical protein
VLIIASMIERRPRCPRTAASSRRSSTTACRRTSARHRRDAALSPEQLEQGAARVELNIDSDFNTRRRVGLPPTPIGNPGLASIQAAANPANAKYLFYVVKPCGNGAHAFSTTDAQFQKDVTAYNRARDKRGGKDPSHC